MQYFLAEHRITDRAIAFSIRGSSALATTALRRWHQVYTTHQNAQAFAVRYSNTQLAYRMLFLWRLRLRAQAKQARQARHAEKFFVTRSAWRKWAEKVKERKREKKVKEFEARVAGRYLREWAQRAQIERQRKLSEEIIRKRVELVSLKVTLALEFTHAMVQRIMSNALNHWTNRVADIKFREFETQKRYETALVTYVAIGHWI